MTNTVNIPLILKVSGQVPEIPNPINLIYGDSGFDPTIHLMVGQQAYNVIDDKWYYRSRTSIEQSNIITETVEWISGSTKPNINADMFIGDLYEGENHIVKYVSSDLQTIAYIDTIDSSIVFFNPPIRDDINYDFSDNYQNSFVDSKGRILIDNSSLGDETKNIIVRLNPDGTVDDTWQMNTAYLWSIDIYRCGQIIELNDGTYVITTYTSNTNSPIAIRLSENGTIIYEYFSSTMDERNARAIILLSNGNFAIGTEISGTAHISTFSPSGTPIFQTNLNGNNTGSYADYMLEIPNRILIVHRNYAKSLTLDGTIDNTFDSSYLINSDWATTDQKYIYVVDYNIHKLNLDGTLVQTIDMDNLAQSAGYEDIYTYQIKVNGNYLYLASYVAFDNSWDHLGILARLNLADLTLDTTFNIPEITDGNDWTWAESYDVFFTHDKIITIGYFEDYVTAFDYNGNRLPKVGGFVSQLELRLREIENWAITTSERTKIARIDDQITYEIDLVTGTTIPFISCDAQNGDFLLGTKNTITEINSGGKKNITIKNQNTFIKLNDRLGFDYRDVIESMRFVDDYIIIRTRRISSTITYYLKIVNKNTYSTLISRSDSESNLNKWYKIINSKLYYLTYNSYNNRYDLCITYIDTNNTVSETINNLTRAILPLSNGNILCGGAYTGSKIKTYNPALIEISGVTVNLSFNPTDLIYLDEDYMIAVGDGDNILDKVNYNTGEIISSFKTNIISSGVIFNNYTTLFLIVDGYIVYRNYRFDFNGNLLNTIDLSIFNSYYQISNTFDNDILYYGYKFIDGINSPYMIIVNFDEPNFITFEKETDIEINPNSTTLGYNIYTTAYIQYINKINEYQWIVNLNAYTQNFYTIALADKDGYLYYLETEKAIEKTELYKMNNIDVIYKDSANEDNVGNNNSLISLNNDSYNIISKRLLNNEIVYLSDSYVANTHQKFDFEYKIIFTFKIINDMVYMSVPYFDNMLRKYTPDGTNDTNYGFDRSSISTGNGAIYGIIGLKNDRLLCYGHDLFGYPKQPRFWKINKDGSIDTTYTNNFISTYGSNNTANNTVLSGIVQSDESFIFLDRTSGINKLVKVDPDGVWNYLFYTKTKNTLNTYYRKITLLNNDNFIIGGISGITNFYYSDGTLNYNFNTNYINSSPNLSAINDIIKLSDELLLFCYNTAPFLVCYNMDGTKNITISSNLPTLQYKINTNCRVIGEYFYYCEDDITKTLQRININTGYQDILFGNNTKSNSIYYATGIDSFSDNILLVSYSYDEYRISLGNGSYKANKFELLNMDGTIYTPDTITRYKSLALDKINRSLGNTILKTLTSNEYDSLYTNNKIDKDTLYFIKETPDLSPTDNLVLEFSMSAGEALTLPLSPNGSYGCFIDWGDGSEFTEILNDYDIASHTYMSGGIYQVSINGTFRGLFFNNLGNKLNLLRVLQWGNVKFTTFENAFYGCENLTELPTDAIPDTGLIKNFNNAFKNCKSLTSIPANIFSNAINAKYFENTFYGCTTLTEIPSTLFLNNIYVTNGFYGTFYGCENLNNIPNGLFNNNINATSFDSTFYGCYTLTGIPNGLFNNNINVTSFDSTFYGCYGLTEIPNIFDNCVSVIKFNNTFYGCYNITSIAPSLFDNCINVEHFDSTFYNCYSLTGITIGLFTQNSNVTSFNSTFYGCSGITNIPIGIFDNCVSVTSFNHTFSNCVGLTTIPSNLFFYNSQVIDYSYCFYRCNKLSLPASIFNVSNLSIVTNWEYFMAVSTTSKSHTGTLQTIWSGTTTNIVTVSAFKNNISISNYSQIPLTWGGTYSDDPKFIMEFAITGTTSLNRTLTIPLYNTSGYNLSINWGDGTSSTGITTYNSTLLSHAYATTGTYQVSLSGVCKGIYFNNAGAKTRLTKIIQWGNVGFTTFQNAFYGCSNLIQLPNTCITGAPTVTSMNNAFYGTKISIIPTGLFDLCPNITNFGSTFYNCSSLTKINNCFEFNNSVTNFESTFYGCSKIIEIPTDLFKYNTYLSASAFYRTFYGCSNLQYIPKDTFKYNINCTSHAFYRTFYGCVSLSILPDDLFKYNVNVSTSAFEDTFNGCTNLISLPDDLFRYNINVSTRAFYQTFYDCSNLRYLPNDLFKYNIKVSTDGYYKTFYNCVALKTIPSSLFNASLSFYQTFYGCTSLVNIPSGIFDFASGNTTFNGTFYGCTKLTSIGENLFTNNISATDFTNLFYGCTSLLNIPSGLFNNCISATTFSGTFYNCSNSGLTIPEDLFYYNENVTSYSYCFRGIRNIKLPNRLFNILNLHKVTNWSYFIYTNDLYSPTGTMQNIWDVSYTITPTTTNAFYGCINLNNYYNEIPTTWSGGYIAPLTSDFVLKFQMQSGETLTLPLDVTGTYNFTVNWDDGQPNNTIDSYNDNTGHTYKYAGDYKVRISGTFSTIRFNNTGNKYNLIDIVQWGDVEFDNFLYAFYGCSRITQLPEHIKGNVLDFSYAFRDCTGLTNISENIFEYNSGATNFTGTFYNCSKLESIPANLFNSCTGVTTFNSTFYNCSKLESIPANLFNSCTGVTTFNNTFSLCSNSGLTIPEDLFYYNANVTNFSYVFNRCRNIILPTRLFNPINLPKVTSWQYCFAVENTIYSFTGTMQNIWDISYISTPNQTNCFNKNTNLTNYCLIPIAWGGDGVPCTTTTSTAAPTTTSTAAPTTTTTTTI